MKFIKNIKLYTASLIIAMGCSVASCDYLEVVPTEKPTLPDATKDYNTTLGFLYSCYAGIQNPVYFSNPEGSADEFAIPELWGYACQNVGYGLYTPHNLLDHRWGNYYRFIGQCHLFLQELENARGVTEQDKIRWIAEAKFLIAYYHFEVLRFYGPCPITDSYVPMDTPNSQYNGRSHYDYVTNWIVDLLDEAANNGLPTNGDGVAADDKIKDSEWGRATIAIAKALKARVLLYAASPLWNGQFPYTTWKNKVETPGYGTELVSTKYDKTKWERALTACNEAIAAAEAEGFELYKDENFYVAQKIPLPYIPGMSNNEEYDAFKKKVLLMRYLVTAGPKDGNKEFIWGLNTGNDAMVMHSLPTRILKQSDGNWYSGWSGIAPTLNSVEYFYTVNGKTPDMDKDFAREDDWFNSGNLPGREDIIKLNIRREPRFYAWFAFDGGDYGSKLQNGQPLVLRLRDNQLQGLNPALFNRDHCSTGYMSQKYLHPDAVVNSTGSLSLGGNPPRPLIRMAELYLNLAECQASLGQQEKAISTLNIIRNRAGVPDLTESDITSEKPIIEWVRNERFIELWGEGHRYFDVRRWVQGPKYFGAGKRKALNAEEKQNPAFEEYNKPVQLARPYVWESRMYLAPVFYNEAYKNPQMVQAPGY